MTTKLALQKILEGITKTEDKDKHSQEGYKRNKIMILGRQKPRDAQMLQFNKQNDGNQ